MKTFQEIALEIAKELEEKNKSYGSSFEKMAIFLELLYPNGIKKENYSDVLIQVRIFDKMMRVANRKEAYGENPYKDLAGYAILGVYKEINKK